jgi:phage-related protein
VKDFLREIHGSIGPVVRGFLNVAAQASNFGGALGERVGTALFQLGQFMQNLDVGAIFERAIPILQALGTFLANIGSIAANLFSVFNVDGANAASMLGELTGKLAAFLDSAAGQEALRALGEAMGAISGAAGQVFLTLLQELAPIIVALAPGVGQLATQLASVLVPALRILGPILEDIAGFLSENMDWVGPLAIAIVAAAGAYRTYTAAVAAWKAVETVAQALRLKSVGTWIANTAAIVANRVAIAAHAVATAATRVPILLATAAQWLWNASLYGFPLVWIIAAIVAVIAIVILLVKNWDEVVKFFGKAWEWLKDIFQKGLDFVIAYWKFVWGAVISYIEFVINFWRTIFSAIWNFVKTTFQNGVNFVRNSIQFWLNFLQQAILKIREYMLRVAQFFLDMRNAVVQRINDAITTVKGLPGRILSALGNLGRLLYNKGRDLITGFINGLLSMLGRVRDAASNIVGAVTDFLPGSPAKDGPLSGRGYALLRARRMMEDLAKGIQDGAGLPVAAMAGAVSPVASAASGGISGASTGGSTTVVNNTGGALSIGQLIVRGVFDPTDPGATRQLVGNLHDAIETYKREYK